MEGGPAMKYFSGDDGDHREYRRWKQWVQSKMLTMDKLPKEARGAFIFTLLQGRALEVVEHLDATDYQKEGGDRVILELLDKRWPQKDRRARLRGVSFGGEGGRGHQDVELAGPGGLRPVPPKDRGLLPG